MDAYRWWHSRLGRYNFWVALSGLSAAFSAALIISAYPQAFPEAEITILALVFQGTAYLIVMLVANLTMLFVAPTLEKILKPATEEKFRIVLFRIAFWCSCITPFLIPLALMIKAIGSPASPSSFEGY